MFADDVKLVKECTTEADCVALQQDIDLVHAWSLQNKLLFNPTKCEIMTFTRSAAPLQYQYAVGGVPVTRVQQVRDLGVVFDPQLTFHQQVQGVTAAAHRRLGFVLRNSIALNNTATRTLYAALVRSVLENNSVVWSPHEDKYVLMLEQIQKQFLRNLYKRTFHYYPFLYPTLYIQGQLGYETLEMRRCLALIKFTLGLLHNKIDCTALIHEFVRLDVPNMCLASRLRPRSRPVLWDPPARTVHANHAPAARARSLLASVHAAAPECDVFTTGIGRMVNECKRICEANARVTTVPI